MTSAPEHNTELGKIGAFSAFGLIAADNRADFAGGVRSVLLPGALLAGVQSQVGFAGNHLVCAEEHDAAISAFALRVLQHNSQGLLRLYFDSCLKIAPLRYVVFCGSLIEATLPHPQLLLPKLLIPIYSFGTTLLAVTYHKDPKMQGIRH